MYFNIYNVFYSRHSHKHVSTGTPTIFRVMFLLREYECGLTVSPSPAGTCVVRILWGEKNTL